MSSAAFAYRPASRPHPKGRPRCLVPLSAQPLRAARIRRDRVIDVVRRRDQVIGLEKIQPRFKTVRIVDVRIGYFCCIIHGSERFLCHRTL